MKVLVVGGGGREHALAWKVEQSPSVEEVFVLPGNAGTATFATNVPGKPGDIPAVVDKAKELGVGLVVVGPEDPLVAGIVDALEAAGIPAFGPPKAAAQLEGSKAFSKELMQRHGVPTAEFGVFTDADEAAAYVRDKGGPIVVKADGLAAGKGVVVARTTEEALEAVDHIMRQRAFGEAGDKVVIEACLTGQEVSYHVVCDGERYVRLAPAQDHKRVGEGDAGPNTGGMGAYSPPPVVTDEVEQRIIETVVEPTPKGMAKDGTPFRGVLFIGLMVDDGVPQVLEYNVRFGDPETEVLMARWDGDVLPLLLGAAKGDLSGVETKWAAPAALCVVMASEGYPASYPKGRVIEGLADEQDDVHVFQAGTAESEGRTVTSGGRVLCVSAIGDDIDQAAERAYARVKSISFEGAHYRRDIGHHARTR